VNSYERKQDFGLVFIKYHQFVIILIGVVVIVAFIVILLSIGISKTIINPLVLAINNLDSIAKR
jgi:hypothetical protein